MTSPPPHLPISETFVSIQGEGKLAGVPSSFIRVSGCNLRCSWCDTPYASWSPEGRSVSIADLVGECSQRAARHVVVTGGEPMMFDQIVPLCDSLRAAGLHTTIETAGAVFRPVACDLMSISPKLANSTPVAGDPRDPGGLWRARHESRRINLESLQSLIDSHPLRQLKFVVRDESDLPEIESLLSSLRAWSCDDVLLMPEGVTSQALAARTWIAAACIERGWRYCPRLHVDLFGHRRGT